MVDGGLADRLACRRTKASYKGMEADFEGSCKERLIVKIKRLALFVASVH